MTNCPNCNAAFPDPSMTSCEICGWKSGEVSITVTDGELYFILSCIEGRKALVELLTPGDFGEDEIPENIDRLLEKIKGQIK